MPQQKNNPNSEETLSVSNEELQQMQQQLNLVKQEYNEMHTLHESLSKLAELKKDDEMLVSVGKGIFIQAKMQNTSNVLVDVGSKVIIRKKLDDARKMIERESTQLKMYAEELEKQFNMLLMHAGH